MRALDIHGGVTKNNNGEEMLAFLKHNEMKTLNDRVKERNGLDSAYQREKVLSLTL